MRRHPFWEGEEAEPVVYDPVAGVYKTRRPKLAIPRIHWVLFFLTMISTFMVGKIFFPGTLGAAIYSFSILAILLTHEMGHFFVARCHHIPATLPFFIPLPLPPFGTLGAVIRMDGRWATRKQLFDVAVAGPLAGLVIALPVTVIGLSLSEAASISEGVDRLPSPGGSILFLALRDWIHGDLSRGDVLRYHPMAYAGWVGLFVTALNLLPIGQLDGGHILYGLLGKTSAPLSQVVFVGMALLALIKSPGWLPLVLLLLYFGYRHPPALEEEVGLDNRRKWIGALTLLLFVLAFSPVPLRYPVP